jgi:hypothetical protein
VESRYYLTGIAIAAAIVLFALATIAMVAYVIYYYVLRGLLARTTTVPARVLRKYQREHYEGGSSSYDDEGLISRGADLVTSSYDLSVLFDVRGKEMDFPVPEHVYADISEGDAGLLTHKGTLFRRFLKETDLPVQAVGKARIRKV